jgi:hypothetical protein
MPNYRRAFVPGGCWFFTVNLFDRRTRLLTDHTGAPAWRTTFLSADRKCGDMSAAFRAPQTASPSTTLKISVHGRNAA